jgi:hypothetical protein
MSKASKHELAGSHPSEPVPIPYATALQACALANVSQGNLFLLIHVRLVCITDVLQTDCVPISICMAIG